MKKLVYILIVLLTVSCDDFLDVPRESLDITEEEIFSNYNETKKFLTSVYVDMWKITYAPAWNWINNNWFANFPNAASDESVFIDNRMAEVDWYNYDFVVARFINYPGCDHHHWEYWNGAWSAIRKSNIILAKAYMLKDCTLKEKNEIMGQALYARAYAYHHLLNLWGGMPYLKDHTVTDYTQLSRLSYYEVVEQIVKDCDEIISKDLLPESWENNDLQDPYANVDYGRFTSVMAKGLKSRVLLYGASPLNNKENNLEKWQAAADASWDAIQFAEAAGYQLKDSANYAKIFRGEYANKELIQVVNSSHIRGLGLPGPTAGTRVVDWEFGRFFMPATIFGIDEPWKYMKGFDVCEDFTEKFEAVKRDNTGKIIESASLIEAENKGYFNPQDPFNPMVRDPRFYIAIIYHGRKKGSSTWNFDEATRTTNEMGGDDDFDRGINPQNRSGFYCGKYYNDVDYETRNVKSPWTWNLMRLAELYLNYAEAANMAYGGPNGKSPNSGLTALEAINIIRNRVGMPKLQITNQVEFNSKIMDERGVELCFEWMHRYIDVRRWKYIEDERYQHPKRIYITKDYSNDKSKYPTGYVFDIKPISFDGGSSEAIRKFEPKHYLFPVSKIDVYRSKVFLQNPGY